MAAQHVPAPNHPFRISQPGRPQHYSRRSRRTRHGRSACTACGAGRSSPTAGPLASFTGCWWCVAFRHAGPGDCSLPSTLVHSLLFFPVQVRVRLACWCVNELPSLQYSALALHAFSVAPFRRGSALLRYVGIGGSVLLRSTLQTKRGVSTD